MSNTRHNEVPGNVLATAALTARILERTGHRVHLAAHSMQTHEANDLRIRNIAFKCRGGIGGDWLAVVTARTAEGGVVAFHSGDGFVATVEGVLAKITNGSLMWKEDEYAK